MITKYVKNVQLPNTKAQTIFSVIKDLLIRCSLYLSNCRGQAFDGASNMSGKNNGIQALVKKEQKSALYVHCLAHSLNLCVQCIAKQCELIRNVMAFMYELLQLIKFSPKRLTLFDSIRAQESLHSPALRSLCPTRWTVKNGSIESVLHNLKGSGLLVQMESFDVFFGLKLAHLVFAASEQLFTNLQAKDITMQEATRGAELLTTHYKSPRNETKFCSCKVIWTHRSS